MIPELTSMPQHVEVSGLNTSQSFGLTVLRVVRAGDGKALALKDPRILTQLRSKAATLLFTLLISEGTKGVDAVHMCLTPWYGMEVEPPRRALQVVRVLPLQPAWRTGCGFIVFKSKIKKVAVTATRED